jgi:hypothetical protein
MTAGRTSTTSGDDLAQATARALRAEEERDKLVIERDNLLQAACLAEADITTLTASNVRLTADLDALRREQEEEYE